MPRPDGESPETPASPAAMAAASPPPPRSAESAVLQKQRVLANASESWLHKKGFVL